VDRGRIYSPGKESYVAVFSHDGGALHSGNFLTYLIAHRWWGKEVVASGYLGSSRGDVPLKWQDETTFSITFKKSKNGREEATITVNLAE
jgi:hypothetical protein